MLYEIVCLLIAAFGAYGFYTALCRLARKASDPSVPSARALRIRPGFSYEEIEEAIDGMQGELPDREEPVLLIDFPLRSEVLAELRTLGVELYLSYEEYYYEKGKRNNG